MKPILIVVAPYYQTVADMLLFGAVRAIEKTNHKHEIVVVPGAFEIPGAVAMAQQGNQYAGFVALGCVIRGDTSHYDIVCQQSARGLQELTVWEHTAIGLGILTCETMEQAILRADPEQGDKGGEAAVACLRMVAIRRQFGLDL